MSNLVFPTHWRIPTLAMLGTCPLWHDLFANFNLMWYTWISVNLVNVGKTYNCYGKFLECSIHCQTMFWNLWQVFSHLCPSCAPDRPGIQWTFSNVACSAVSASFGTSCGSKRGQDHNFMIMGYGLWDFDLWPISWRHWPWHLSFGLKGLVI